MAADRKKHILDYFHKVRAANKELTKKEAFKDLLNRLYNADPDILQLIDSITAGAEKTVVNIPRSDRFHHGSADTLYNRIIIEFENDLKVTQKHATTQLAGYLLGQFHSGEGYNFTLIASDFIRWRVFSPDILQIEKLEEFTEETLILREVDSAAFHLTEENTDEFYFWIDRFLFREEPQKATLRRVEESFGYQSPVFIECFRQLKDHFQDIQKYGEVQVSFEQWKKFLSVAYGSFDAGEDHFMIHTYLSLFSKMLAYSVVSNDEYITDDQMKGIIDGAIFDQYNIRNFVDYDFFFWIKNDRSFHALKKVFRLIAQEISCYDFSHVDEDILKGVYQELIDLDTRHALGEYYTPDWLCERIVNSFQFKADDKILDPSCGSGSFLRAAVHRLKSLHPDLPAEQINDQIFGIDIHPLSVQIAKTNLLIALGKEIIQAKRPVHFNIILANTLLAPDGVDSLFGKEFRLTIDQEEYLLNTQILEEIDLFDEGLEVCEELAEHSCRHKAEEEKFFESMLRKRLPNKGFNGNITSGFYKIYLGLKAAKEKGRDGIWKFILQNIYKPYFLQGKFDYIVGNPPWFTYSSIKNEEYQNILNTLADLYSVKPDKKANFPHLEIAAVFLAHCCNYFLKEKGKLAFVLPRSFFSADHHDNTRSGKAKGFRLTEIWDLNSVSPLFRVPSCVFFAEKANGTRSLPASGLTGRSFAGKVPRHNCNLTEANTGITENEVKWFFVRQGGASAFTTRKIKGQNKENPYKKLFKQGATIVPRTFYFVELFQQQPPDFNDRIINVRTLETIKSDAKIPWKGVTFAARIESRFLFRTALSRSILPFCLYKPDFVVLPVIIQQDQGNQKRKISILTSDDILHEGYLDTAKWFKNAERIWNLQKTAKSKNMSANDRLNYQRGLTGQQIDAPFMVLYNSSAKDANATIAKRDEFDLEFIAESVTYVYFTSSLSEAYYLTAVINSTLPNIMMKDFQAKGLFGARHVHKKILDIWFPRFDPENEIHLQLAAISRLAHQKAEKYLEANPPAKELSAVQLGRLRLEIKTALSDEMKEIDRIVGKIMK
jgi:type I restriction-modification system DNA methylase subunit